MGSRLENLPEGLRDLLFEKQMNRGKSFQKRGEEGSLTYTPGPGQCPAPQGVPRACTHARLLTRNSHRAVHETPVEATGNLAPPLLLSTLTACPGTSTATLPSQADKGHSYH